jgi:hypothetical protein
MIAIDHSSGWFKSSKSGGGNCVEVSFAEEGVLVRDSKSRERAVLRFTAAEWDAFIAGVAMGEFDVRRDQERAS